MNIKLIQLQQHGDQRGALIALEETRNVPFSVKRVYYLFDTGESVRRGFHAHHQGRQMAIAVRGHCRFLLDDGREKIDVFLDNPAQGLLIEPMIWHEMYDFSSDCVLMVLADDFYNENDYLRDREQFISLVDKQHG